MTGHYPVAYFTLFYIGAVLTALAAWVTHVVVCIKAASFLFLIAGAILPPIGVIHGWGVWLGVW
ncbi:hypothetical protein ABIE79_010060 [Bradyrhizobium diazoefficiens]